MGMRKCNGLISEVNRESTPVKCFVNTRGSGGNNQMINRFRPRLSLCYAYSGGEGVSLLTPARPTCRSDLQLPWSALPRPMTQQWEARPDP